MSPDDVTDPTDKRIVRAVNEILNDARNLTTAQWADATEAYHAQPAQMDARAAVDRLLPEGSARLGIYADALGQVRKLRQYKAIPPFPACSLLVTDACLATITDTAAPAGLRPDPDHIRILLAPWRASTKETATP